MKTVDNFEKVKNLPITQNIEKVNGWEMKEQISGNQ